MKDIKKIMITLVALLAVTTGAWAADYLYLEVDGTSATVKYGADKGTNPYYGDNPMSPGNYGWYVAMDEHMPDKVTSYSGKNTLTTVTIDASCQNYTGTTLESLFDYCSVLTTINNLENLNTSEVTNMKRMFKMCTALTSLDLSGWNTAKVTNMYEMFYGSASSGSALETLDLSGWNTSSVTDMRYMFQNCTTLKNIYVGDGWSTASVTTDTKMFDKCTNLPNWDGTIDKTNAHTGDGGYLKVKPAAPSGPTVAWNKTSKTGSFDMPGGNVELEPEYYPQAAFATGGAPTAINDVPATTDGAIVKAGTVANIGSTTTAQGTVMYYVSQTALDDAALLALAADQWTADVPTAESFTAAGQAHVYYYVRGNDSDNDDENFSDGDILATNVLTVTIAAAPTYAVTFADDLAEPDKWTASPAADVTKGQTVTVTYSGTKKVIGVKAEVKKRPEFVPSATIQNLESFVEVENNRDGTITLHMPTLNPSTYNVTNSSYLSNGEHTLHFGYEIGSGTDMSAIGTNFNTRQGWSDHTPFSELDKTIDITSGKPRVAILITGHLQSATCPAPGAEHYWGLYRYTNPVKVTYNLGGGSVSGSTADKVEYLFSGDALATTFAAPTREGFTFDGWYTSAEGGTKLTASNATSATTIYAHWNAIAE